MRREKTALVNASEAGTITSCSLITIYCGTTKGISQLGENRDRTQGAAEQGIRRLEVWGGVFYLERLGIFPSRRSDLQDLVDVQEGYVSFMFVSSALRRIGYRVAQDHVNGLVYLRIRND